MLECSYMQRSGDWLKQAERDLEAAKTNSAAGFHEWAALASQQCAEKAVKAIALDIQGSERMHGITELLAAIASEEQLPEAVRAGARDLDAVYEQFSAGLMAEGFTEATSLKRITAARIILDFCRARIS